MLLILVMTLKINVVEVNISNPLFVLHFGRIRYSIGDLASCEFLELHHVLGECPCLVREYVVNHP